MNECPYCNQLAMTPRQKCSVGPAVTTRCNSCGERISVSWSAMLGNIPFLISIFLSARLLSVHWSLSVLALGFGIGIMFVIHAYLAPLVKRGA
jgi:hypothetical protein